MAIDTKLEEWKSDFSGQDTNLPDQESLIGTSLGGEFRALKELSKKDLSNSQDLTNQNVITYSVKTTPMPAPGTGKPYALYKSATPAEITANALVPHDLIATGVGNQSSTSMVDYSFQIMGDWEEVLFPGTPLCVSSDGFKKFASLQITGAQSNQPANTGYEAFGPASKINFHPQLVPFPRADEVCASDVSFLLLKSGSVSAHIWELKVVNGNDASKFKCANPKGRRIQVIRLEKTTSRGTNYPDNATDLNEYYPNGSYSLVMDGSYRNVGNDRYIGLYAYAKDLAVEVDGMTESEAEAAFGQTDNLLQTQMTTYCGLDNTSANPWTPSSGAGASDSLTTKYVMRMSNEEFLKNPENSGDVITTPDSAYYLVGTQNGNRELNGQQHESISYRIIVQNAGQNETKTFEFGSGKLAYPMSYRGLVEDKGTDYRAFIKCVEVVSSEEGFELTTDIACPEVSMNEWSGTNWASVSQRNRETVKFSIKFRKPFVATIVYDVTILTPSLNGKTPYKRDNVS